jgi:hypothetical protein
MKSVPKTTLFETHFKVMKVIFFILLSCIFVDAQSAINLREKYGAPTSETFTEVYQARPYNEKTRLSVDVTVTYNKNKQICLLKAEIFPYSSNMNEPTTKEENELKSNLLREVLDELLPKEKRGKNIINGFVNMSCLPQDGCFGTFEEYEKVSIYYNGNSHRYASISWKDISCQ